MFAGPNGSGKSALKSLLPPELLGVYINPDEMERELCQKGFLDLDAYRVVVADDKVRQFFHGSLLLAQAGIAEEAADLVLVRDGRLHYEPTKANSYVASVVADLFRQHLLATKSTFTFETVMSHSSKVNSLKSAQELGFRTYLYFIATDDPMINVSRVKSRVRLGGHAVPEDRIVKRYYASLELLMKAVRYTNRAYIFDNSGEEREWLAEIVDGREMEMKS